jgi:hypothetical protein
MHQAIPCEDEVESLVLEREIGRVTLLKGDAAPSPVLHASDLKKCRILIEPDALTIYRHESSEQLSRLTESAPDIEPPA